MNRDARGRLETVSVATYSPGTGRSSNTTASVAEIVARIVAAYGART